MLKEISNAKQNTGEPFRRIFNDEDFYLILWFDDSKDEVLSFQLFYGKETQKKCAVWKEGSRVSFRAVDDGENRPFRYKMSPVFQEDGLRPNDEIIESFKKSCRNLDFYIADKVLRAIGN